MQVATRSGGIRDYYRHRRSDGDAAAAADVDYADVVSIPAETTGRR
jgi:hypothetical protein